ncbi:MAG: UDP-N-acetylmuramate dehydrogenase [candidate division WOR-3 bacterium]
MADRKRIIKLLKGKIKGRIRQGVKIGPLTSFGIGGPARYLIDVYDLKSLLTVLRVLKEQKIKVFLLGQGTNILVSDRGFNGAVIRLKGSFTKIEHRGNLLIAGAGARLIDVVKTAHHAGLSGLEFAIGIPGSVGGALKMNAGAFGESIGPCVKKLWAVDGNLMHKCYSKRELKFAYRSSNIGKNTIITRAVLKLKPAARTEICAREEYLQKYRWAHQPRGKSAGSIFKNPKTISAGRLIEECGLKGKRIGDAVISEKHANFIINCGKARARDVKRLIQLIKDRVYKLKKVKLTEEVILLD